MPTNTNVVESFTRPASHTFFARYKMLRSVTKIAPFTYIINGASNYMRGSEEMIDFEGGPCIIVGMKASDVLGSPPWCDKNEFVIKVEHIGAAEGRELCGVESNDKNAWVRVFTAVR